MTVLQIEHDFELPLGYVDEDGNLHKTGTMRLATAADEVLPMRDPRVQQNPSYLSIIILSRVVVKLGSLKMVTPRTVENLFTKDFNYLQRMYSQINGVDDNSEN